MLNSFIMKLEDFISKEGQQSIADAIARAERHTSGEMCVHVTPRCRGDVMKRAMSKFNQLELYKTKRRNAVLVFIAYQSKKFAILGDYAINRAVPGDFWDSEKDTLLQYLKAGKPVEGVCEVVEHIGNRLAAFFPAEREDENEISNEVTFDDDEK